MEFICATIGTSYFKLIDKYALGENNRRPIHRIFNLMRKLNAQTLIVEELPSDSSVVKDEIDALSRYFADQLESKIFQLTFTLESVGNSDEIVTREKCCTFLSTTIVVNFRRPGHPWFSYVFSAVVSKPFMIDNQGDQYGLLNNYLHTIRAYKYSIGHTDQSINFEICGVFFSQQNTFTSVCSHSAVCTAINNSSCRTEIVYPEDINKILGVDHVSKKFNHNTGINIVDIKNLFEHFNFEVAVKNFINDPRNIKYSDFIYRYIESNSPCLMIFSTKDDTDLHIVPIIGHTINSDLWRPEAERAYIKAGQIKYKSSSAWIDHFIINDDNFGMYHCLPIDSLWKPTSPKDDPSFRAAFTISLLPPIVKTSCEYAEICNITYLEAIIVHLANSGSQLNYWTKELANSVLKPEPFVPFVSRTFLVNKETYAESLQKSDFEGNKYSLTEKQQILNNLPDKFWLSEISLPDLFTTNKTKLADFISRCDIPVSQPQDITSLFIQGVLPGVLVTNTATFDLSVESHYPLLRHSHETGRLEW